MTIDARWLWLAFRAGRAGDLHFPRSRKHSPQESCALMRDSRRRTAHEHPGMEAASGIENVVADRKNSTKQPEENSGGDHSVDSVVRKAQFEQLGSRSNSMLPSDQRQDLGRQAANCSSA